MKRQLCSKVLGFAAIAMVLSADRMVWGQPANFSQQIVVPHTPWNDGMTKVQRSASKVFASPEGRKTSGAELLKALDDFQPLLQKAIDQPGSVDPEMFKLLQAKPAAAREVKEWNMLEHRLFNIMRLALDEPKTVEANQAQAAAKGSASAAQTAVDRAAADWLIADNDSQSESDAFNKLRSAIQATGQKLASQTWRDLLHYHEPNTLPVLSSMLEYLHTYPRDFILNGILDTQQRRKTRMELEGTPLTLQGTLLSGKKFSTADWKRKVVLVGVFATECGVGVDQEVARVQKIAAKYRSQGLESVEIAHSPTITTLKQFLTKHPELTIPEIYKGPFKPNRATAGGAKPDPTDEIGALIIDRKGMMHWGNLPDDKLDGEIGKRLAEEP